MVDSQRSMSLSDPGSAPTPTPAHESAVDNEAYAKALGARLRSVRNQQHLSLQGVEKRSSGRWKAVVIGSYERGDRAVSVRRLRELAEFYGVPVSTLLPPDHTGPTRVHGVRPPRTALSLDHVASLTDPDADTLKRFVVSIQLQRGTPADRMVGVRQDDLGTLAIMYGCTVSALTMRLRNWQVLVSESATVGDQP